VRENTIIGLVIGLLFFGGSAALTALAIKQATNSALWDFVLWGGVTMLLSSIATLALFISSQYFGSPFVIPALLINLGLCLIVGGLVWHLSGGRGTANPVATEALGIAINFEPREPYETSKISSGQVSSTVSIGLKALGKSFSNCDVYIEKIAPEPPLMGGLPILLNGGGFVLRPDDPEHLVDIAFQWGRSNEFRFNAPFGTFAETMNYIKDDVPHMIEIRVKSKGAETTEKAALFKIWTDESKKLHLERM
jgi:hypothetical protein